MADGPIEILLPHCPRPICGAMGQTQRRWGNGWGKMNKKSLKALAQAVYSVGQPAGQVRGNEHLSAPKAAGQDDAAGAADELAPLPQTLALGAVGQPAPVDLSPIVTLDEIAKIVDSFDAQFLGIKPKGWLPGC